MNISKITNTTPDTIQAVFFSMLVLLAGSLLSPSAQAQSVRFAVVGDFGNGSQGQADVARLIDSKNVSFVATVGDNVYGGAANGTPLQAIDDKIGKYYHRYMHPYNGRYGSGSADGRNNFFPVLGNHDYGHGGDLDIPLMDCVEGGGLNSCSQDKGAWYDYFNLPGNERYYSVRRGAVEIFAYSDYYRDPDWAYDENQNGVVQWLKKALAASTAPWKVVLLHFPPYASRLDGGYKIRRHDFKGWGADAVIAGHVHNYERLNVDGMLYFVNGAGGVSVHPGRPLSPYSVKQVSDDLGAMIITADASSIKYDYFTRDGRLRDTISQNKDAPPENEQYRWQSVPIGGGGYITGIEIHPKNRNLVYARTDVGGSYRWNAQNDSWIALNENIPFDSRGMYGIESMALDPANQNVVYAAVGSRPDICKCDIIKSTDRGATWTAAGLTGVRMAANSRGRWSGERLAVDPNNGNVVYFGSRFDGLWRSQGASRPGSWSRIAQATFPTSQPARDRDRGAISFVAFDPSSAAGGRSQTIYVGVFDRGVFRSTNGGNSFSLVPGSPKWVERGVVAADGTFYVTYAADDRVNESARGGGVSKLTRSQWSSITPPGGSRAFSGLDVSVTQPAVVVVAERSISALGNNRLYRSTNRGGGWTEVGRNNISLNLDGSWGGAGNWSTATADVAIDPGNSNRVWLTSWFGVWRTDNFSAARSVWKPIVDGHEELVIHIVKSPTAGAPLLSGAADHGGFRHEDPLSRAPDMRLGDVEWRNGRPRIQDTEGLDYAGLKPQILVRAGGRYWGPQGDGEYSEDNGKTWKLFSRPASVVQGGVVAITANATSVVWIPRDEANEKRNEVNEVYVSNDFGASWGEASFSPPLSGALVKSRWTPKQPLAADRAQDGTLYLLDYQASRFYRSTDGGFSWQGTFVFSGDRAISKSDWDYQTVKARPGTAREVWVNSAASGLFRSTNGGNSFNKIAGVTKALSFAFGKARPGSNVPTLFLYGKVNGFGNDYSVFRSTNLGQNWTDIGADQTMGNGPSTMAGDMQVYGRVYIGTGGRGVYVGHIGNDEPGAPATFSINDLSVNETVGTAQVVVRLSRAENTEQSIGFATVPGTASRAQDFYGTSGRLVFAPGETIKRFNVQILDDATVESTETISTRLFKSSGPAVARANGVISINDND